jgi:hypothetical protein
LVCSIVVTPAGVGALSSQSATERVLDPRAWLSLPRKFNRSVALANFKLGARSWGAATLLGSAAGFLSTLSGAPFTATEIWIFSWTIVDWRRKSAGSCVRGQSAIPRRSRLRWKAL